MRRNVSAINTTRTLKGDVIDRLQIDICCLVSLKEQGGPPFPALQRGSRVPKSLQLLSQHRGHDALIDQSEAPASVYV